MKLDCSLLRTIFYVITSGSNITPVETLEIRRHECDSTICKALLRDYFVMKTECFAVVVR